MKKEGNASSEVSEIFLLPFIVLSSTSFGIGFPAPAKCCYRQVYSFECRPRSPPTFPVSPTWLFYITKLILCLVKMFSNLFLHPSLQYTFLKY